MKYDPHESHRRSIRLRDYDYTQAGAYFVTICTQGRVCLFGAVVDGEMELNDAGRMVGRWWGELMTKFPSVALDDCVVMPNHVHGIVIIVGADLGVCPDTPVAEAKGAHTGAPLPRIVQWFKTMTTNEYIRGVKQRGWAPFHGRLWQRNYYEHVIRSEDGLDRIRQYILDNPAKWPEDSDNPQNL